VKIFHTLYSKTISLENLLQAWEEFKHDKRKKLDVGEFEIHLEDNLFKLHHALYSKKYSHGKYSGFFITDPKLRHIHKAILRNRIVQQALFTTLSPIFEPTFIADSYSCRKGYGTHRGFQKLIIYSRKVSKNYTKNFWVLKSDIKKFFGTVDHTLLLQIIGKRIKDHDLFLLIREIIESYNTFPHKGIPIGNLTSQLFSNIYLNELDQFIKHKLQVKYYIRYADDFVILHQNRIILTEYLSAIREFLKRELQLELHPRKTHLRKFSWGVDFLGYIALPYYHIVRTKTKKRIFKKIKENIFLYKKGKLDKKSLDQSLASYFGILKHAHTYKLKQFLQNNIFLWMK